jgi:archaellin
LGGADPDNLIEAGQQFEITIDLYDLGEGKALGENLTSHSVFNIQIKPSLGSTMTIERTLPPAIQPMIYLR